jgi:DNA-directed RNA polymerase
MDQLFEEVLEQYTPMIHHIIRSLNIYKEKERYFHEAAIALWEAWSCFDEHKGSFTSYAYSSIRGKLLNHLKKEIKWEEYHTVMEQMPESQAEPSFPLLENLEDYTQNLTDNQRTWLVEFIYKGRKLKEIANQEGVSVSAVKSWRKEALKKLRGQLLGKA